MEASGLSRISIRRITVGLVVMSGLFVVLGIVTQALSPGPAEPYTWTHLFDLDAEAALPAWFQTTMLLGCALLLWWIGSVRAGEPIARSWKLLAAGFVYLSADENATIHETVGFWISHRFGGALGVYAWLIPGIAFVIVMGLASLKFLRQLPPPFRRQLVIAGAVYLAGAMGVELIEARLDELWGSLPFSMMVVVEESLEMAGMIVLIHALLSYLASLPQRRPLRIDP
jgi:hypothetical protein